MSLPSVDVIADALEETTEVLAAEISAPSERKPQWSPFQWSIATASATMNGMCGLLSTRLRWVGPDTWHDFIREQHRHTQLRAQRIRDLLTQIDCHARGLDLGVIGLKGSALLGLRLYPGEERPMGDIDLLVQPHELPKARALMQRLGYEPAYASWRHDVFDRPGQQLVGYGEHIANGIRIEVHTRAAERLPIELVDITSDVSFAPLPPGLNSYRSRSALMRHLLLHAAGNMRSHALRFIQLHDLAVLSERMNEEDWRQLIDTVDGEEPWWMLPPILLARRYLRMAAPQFVIDRLEAQCPHALKRAYERCPLSTVTWSNIRIPAFPGLEWSRSLRERMRYMRSRVWPTREALAELRRMTTTGAAAHLPWYHQSHVKRIVRWLTSKPPRVQTMYSVRCALGEHPSPAVHDT